MDVLQDLAARFLLSLPDEEFHHVDRVFFQVEQAFWFYEDFFRAETPSLRKYRTLAEFAEALFRSCGLHQMRRDAYEAMVAEFTNYKHRIPVFGCVLMNATLSKVALVLNWKRTSWGFPRGKRNEGEQAMECAIRETYEETGFDATGLVRADSFLSHGADQKSRIYIAVGVPEDAAFSPQTRNEVREVAWFSLASLPAQRDEDTTGKFRGVLPFVNRLRTWVAQQHKRRGRGGGGGGGSGAASGSAAAAAKAPASQRGKASRTATATSSNPRVEPEPAPAAGAGAAAGKGASSARPATPGHDRSAPPAAADWTDFRLDAARVALAVRQAIRGPGASGPAARIE